MIVLFYLRLLELAIMLMAVHWVIHSSPPSRYRSIRLSIAGALTGINLFALGFCILFLHVPLPW